MAYSEDHIALAAEYALGTLDADERAQAETMMSVDKEFAAMVEAWQHKLGVLVARFGARYDTTPLDCRSRRVQKRWGIAILGMLNADAS